MWLASYPKSGNTWVRLLLLNYLADRSEPIPINQAHKLGESDARFALYQAAAADAGGKGGAPNASDHAAILRLRPAVIARQASTGADINFMKTHCRNRAVHGQRLIPAPLTRSAIYILRNPLDILPSYADHYALSLDNAARQMAHPDNAALPDGRMTAQYLGDWSGHVKSWTSEKRFPVCTVRYEDLHAAPRETLDTILGFLGAPVDAARRDRAIAAASFGELRRQEDRDGFVERSSGGTRFFREGRTGGWRETLSPELVAQVRAAHGRTMEKFGYGP